MAVANESTVDLYFLYQQVVPITLPEKEIIIKLSFVILMALFFTYFNAIMIYTLWSKPAFKETPRYILFTHMLVNDSIHLLFTSTLCIFNMGIFQIVTSACAFIMFTSATTSNNTPLNLAVMSLERYVAISYPLRHAEIATQKRTYVAIGVIWFLGSISIIIYLLYGLVVNPKFLTSDIVCTRESLLVKPWQAIVMNGFSMFYFIAVTVIILSTYISIMITARSASSNRASATKAHQTVLLHLVQLVLCLTSFFYKIIERAASMVSSISLYYDLRYISYLFVIILPRCLSPLIYGVRDDAIRPLFLSNFCYSKGKRQVTVNMH